MEEEFKEMIQEEEKEEDLEQSQVCLLFEIGIKSGQISIVALLAVIIQISNLYFFGKMKDERLLAAAGLCDMLIFFSGGMFVIGLNEGFSSLAGRAFGSQNYMLMGSYLNKAALLNTLAFLSPILVAYFGDSILIFLHQDPAVSVIARHYFLISLPSVFLQYTYDLLCAYLNCMKIYHVHSRACLVTTMLHLFFCQIFLPLGMTGIAIASTVTHGINVLVLVSYIVIKKPCPESLHLKKSFNMLPKYFMHVFPVALPICLDAYFFAGKTFIVGSLKTPSILAAYIILRNVLEIFYCVFMGINVSLNTLTANALGEKDLKKCHLYVKFAYFSGVVIGGIFVVLILIFYEPFFSFFTSHEEVLKILFEATTIIASFIIFDFLQQIFQGIIKGVGQGEQVLLAVAFSYQLVGFPSCYLLGIYWGYGLKGIWIGYGISTIILFFINAMILHRINWPVLIDEKYREMQLEKVQQEKEEEDFQTEFELKLNYGKISEEK